MVWCASLRTRKAGTIRRSVFVLTCQSDIPYDRSLDHPLNPCTGFEIEEVRGKVSGLLQGWRGLWSAVVGALLAARVVRVRVLGAERSYDSFLYMFCWTMQVSGCAVWFGSHNLECQGCRSILSLRGGC